MYLPNCKINLSGFQPSLEATRAIETIMQALQAKAPSDSFLNLSIICGESDVNGFLRVVSKSGSFESNHCGIDPLRVCRLLNEELLGKIKIWSTARVF